MKKKIKVMVSIGILLIANKANANPLQISEARLELSRINQSKQEARLTLDKAELAYKALRTAKARQERALALLIKADQAKQLAQRNSINSVENGHSSEAYYADNGAAHGAARLVAVPAYLEGS